MRAFGGSKDIDNLVPQSKYINRSFKENGQWYKMEKEWCSTIEKGGTIKNLKIELKYTSDKMRPSAFRVQYECDGVIVREFIDNI